MSAESSVVGTVAAAQRELVITRIFDAPIADVWQAWTDPEHAVQWWGPHGFTARIEEWQSHPGGRWRAVMRGPDGAEYPQSGIVQELSAPERFAFTLVWENEGPSSEMLVTVSLTARGERTEMLFRKGPFHAADSQQGEEGGWNEAFDRLGAFVSGA